MTNEMNPEMIDNERPEMTPEEVAQIIAENNKYGRHFVDDEPIEAEPAEDEAQEIGVSPDDDPDFDRRGELNAELSSLMSDLSASTSRAGDWKIIKIYEARMHGKEDPYDFDELSALRQEIRKRINEVQEELKKLEPADEDTPNE